MRCPIVRIDRLNYEARQHSLHPSQNSVLSSCTPVAIVLHPLNLPLPDSNSTVYNRVPATEKKMN